MVYDSIDWDKLCRDCDEQDVMAFVLTKEYEKHVDFAEYKRSFVFRLLQDGRLPKKLVS